MALLVKTISTLVAHAPELTSRYYGAVAAWFEGNWVPHGESNPEPLSSRPCVSRGRSIRLMRQNAGLTTIGYGCPFGKLIKLMINQYLSADYWERGLTYRAYSLNPH